MTATILVFAASLMALSQTAFAGTIEVKKCWELQKALPSQVTDLEIPGTVCIEKVVLNLFDGEGYEGHTARIVGTYTLGTEVHSFKQVIRKLEPTYEGVDGYFIGYRINLLKVSGGQATKGERVILTGPVKFSLDLDLEPKAGVYLTAGADLGVSGLVSGRDNGIWVFGAEYR